MQSAAQLAPTAPASNKRLWAGRVLGALPVLFLLFDASMKLVKIQPVVEASARLGFPDGTTRGIGLLLLLCTVLYAVPRTAVLGAVLLTGYLGGAICTHVRAGDPLFPVVFPCFFGAMIWGSLLLRDERLRALFPLRGAAES